MGFKEDEIRALNKISKQLKRIADAIESNKEARNGTTERPSD